tara:strand:+ start:2207 stop:3196 length:990 start_codon:yes stop_codon:yes gene_type:complete
MQIYFHYFLLIILLSILIIVNNKYRYYLGNFFSLVDKPDKKRKFHKFDTPLIGSFPIIIVFLIYSQLIDTNYNYFSDILLISFALFLIGSVDDAKNISYKNKFFVTIIFLILFLSFNKEFLILKISFETIFFEKKLIENHSIFLTVLCMVILINTFNFTDGINGLSSVIAVIWLISLMIIENKFNLHFIFLSFFIFINAIPIFNGKYFIGDSGTLFLGTLIGFETINLFNTSNNINYEQIFLIFMIPGFDMIRLIFSRLSNNNNPFLPDNNHLHHLLIRKYSLFKTLTIYSSLIIFPILIMLAFNIKIIFIIFTCSFLYVLIYKKIKKD